MDPNARTEFILMYELEGVVHEYPLTEQRLVIGRAKNCNLCLPFNAEVSRLHATLIATPEGWLVEDMSSRSGTIVNGQKIDGRRELRDNDVLSIGQVHLTLREKKHHLETVTGDLPLPDELLAAARAQAPAGPAPPRASKTADAPVDRIEHPAAAPFQAPINYYELIGVTSFEPDVAKIQRAAKQRLSELRTESGSQSAADRQAQVDAIADGLASLSNAEKKQLYDSELAERLGVEFEIRGGRVLPVEPTSPALIIVGLAAIVLTFGIMWYALSWLLDAIAPAVRLSG
jgi:hypothetical protein